VFSGHFHSASLSALHSAFHSLTGRVTNANPLAFHPASRWCIGTELAETKRQAMVDFAADGRTTNQGRSQMKVTQAWLVAALLAFAGAAFAQGTGGGSTGDGGAGMATGNDTGAAKAGQNANSSNGMSHSQMQHHTTKGKKKPMNDTTNMPGANASSDTKGQ
jgi:hypothetical protein